ncbi:MAG TPA: carboxypeptidase-like regulatory domain-containing protein [Acidobacteriaceae bacterium]
MIPRADLLSSDPAAQQRVAAQIAPISINGTEQARAEIRLERGASISGTIYYDDGSPAQGVEVRARSTGSQPSAIGTSQGGGSSFYLGQDLPRTDDYGRYRITGLPSGTYAVVVYATLFQPGVGGGSRTSQNGTLIVYAPKNVRLVDAKSFDLKAGNELTGADVLIPLSAFHAVGGSVESQDGITVNAGALNLIDDADKTHTYFASVGSDGRFRFLYVPEGSYTLKISNASITESSSSTGHGGTFKIIQRFGDATQSIAVQSGDLSTIVLQVPPTTATP